MAVAPEEVKSPPTCPESHTRQYLNSLHYSSIQKFEKFTVYTSDARESTDPKEVSEATVKVYEKGNAGEKELLALERLRDLFEDSLPVASLLASYICNGSRFIFVKHLERPLAVEISDRASARPENYWSEDSLWGYMWEISHAIFKVHYVGFVHRNITPYSLFLKQGKLYLFHFESCKELKRGDSDCQATIRGVKSFLSPQALMASNRQAGASGKYTYKISRKDDVWGLGRTLLDMATLRLNDTLQESYRLSPEEFSEHICALIGTRYSSLFKNAITWLLALSDRGRPSFEDFYDWMSGLRRNIDAAMETIAPSENKTLNVRSLLSRGEISTSHASTLRQMPTQRQAPKQYNRVLKLSDGQ